MAGGGDNWSKRQNINDRMYGFTVLFSIEKKQSNYYQKLLEIEKEIVREVARGDKQYLKQPTDCNSQISSMSVTNVFLICALRYADCFRYCLSPRATSRTIFFFYFQ